MWTNQGFAQLSIRDTSMIDKRPRVLFIFTEVFATGGIQRFNQTLLEACRQLPLHMHVLSLKDTTQSLEGRLPGMRATGFSGDRFGFAGAVTAAMVRARYDQVFIGHINFLTLVVAICRFSPWRRNSLLLIAHGIEVWSGINRARRSALHKVSRILCVSAYTRERILEQSRGLDATRLTIFPNALAEKWHEPVGTSPSAGASERFILSVTRLDRGDRDKGLDSTIKAFGMLNDRALQYVIVGSGNDEAYLRSVAVDCKVQDRVRFMNGVADEELRSLYGSCQAFVLPSGKEGFGIVFLEAMYFGAPVIAAAEKGALDVVRDGETGLTVPFGDVGAIRRAIELIISDPGLRQRLRSRGRALVVEGGPFTFKTFLGRCAEVFGAS
jgi:phosphatidyl-myo-inositol dimannoside synthase